MVWKYVFTREGAGTRVTESYEVTRPVSLFGWFVIGVLFGRNDRRGDLRRGMTETLDRLAVVANKATSRP